MTFKHVIPFDDSPVMRSLARVAVQKGLVKEQVINKQAEAAQPAPDYTPAESLTQNVLKLAQGLHQLGLTQYAEELEKVFINYKKAAAQETGADVVNQAHPGGSHAVKDIVGDNVVETILDQQLKDLKVVKKNPTGKLASRNLISQVKILLAQDNTSATSKEDQLAEKTKQIGSLLKKTLSLAADEIRDKLGVDPDIFLQDIIGNYLMHPTLDNLNEAKSRLTQYKKDLTPGFFYGLSKDTWARMGGAFEVIDSWLDQAMVLRSQIDKAEAAQLISGKGDSEDKAVSIAPPQGKNTQAVYETVTKELNAINDIRALLNMDSNLTPEEHKNAFDWLDKTQQHLQQIKGAFDSIDVARKEDNAQYVLNLLAPAQQDIIDFRKQWIGQ